MVEDFSTTQRKIKEFQQALQGLDNQITQEEAEKKALEDKLGLNEGKIRDFQSEINNLQNENRSIRDRLSRINSELPKLRSQKQQIERQKPQLEQTLRKFGK